MSFLSQQFQVFYEENLSPAAQSARLATVAREELAKAIGANRFPQNYQTFVDGQRGADLNAVKPRGTILFEADTIGQAVEFAMIYLVARTVPSRSGRLNSGWRFSVGENGRYFPFRQFVAESVPYGSQVALFNIEPYWRKIETGYVGKRKIKSSIASGIIEDAIEAVEERFSGSVTASRLWTLNYTGQTRQKTGRKELVQAPAMILKTRY